MAELSRSENDCKSNRILLLYPKNPVTLEEYSFALPFYKAKAFMQPLAIITVAGLIPRRYDLRLVDVNIRDLTDDDLAWADLVFITVMSIHKNSFDELSKRCKTAGKIVVAGGPYVTTCHETVENVDHFVLGEAENLMDQFFSDYEGGTLRHVYKEPNREAGFVDLRNTPCPRFDLIDPGKYMMAILQYSRGCPYKCDFCDVPFLFGNKQRTKTIPQFLEELDGLYKVGWKGVVYVIDDNLITNKNVIDLFNEIAKWQRERGFPFKFWAQCTINVSKKPKLLDAMVAAGFQEITCGIETPVKKSLEEINKLHNAKLDLVEAIDILHKKGIRVMSGNIVGFDSDPDNVFDVQTEFIQEAQLLHNFMGILEAPMHTPLFHRLMRENRIVTTFNADSARNNINFTPKNSKSWLITGFLEMVHRVNSPELYFDRCERFILKYEAGSPEKFTTQLGPLWRFLNNTIQEPYTKQFLKSFLRILSKKPKGIPKFIEMSIHGYHFHKMADELTDQLVQTNPDMQQLSKIKYPVPIRHKLRYLRNCEELE